MNSSLSGRSRKSLSRLMLVAGAAFAMPGLAFADNAVIVTNTNDSGPGSLRKALTFASQHGNTTVGFNIPGKDPFVIQPNSALPPLVQIGTNVNGCTQPGYAGLPLVTIRGTKAGPAVNGLNVQSRGCIIQGLTVQGFSGSGIAISGEHASGNLVKACVLGTRTAGTSFPNQVSGISLSLGADGNQIGGATPPARNIISGNGLDGILIDGHGLPGDSIPFTSNNIIRGNYIGTDYTGTSPNPNGRFGVYVFGEAHSNTIGAPVPVFPAPTSKDRNVISGNDGDGIRIEGPYAQDNFVLGNYIGTDASGKYAVPNKQVGVTITDGASGNFIGRSDKTFHNVISGNGSGGVSISSGTAPQFASDNWVLGNYIGTDGTGKNALPNKNYGVAVFDSHGCQIGGNAPGAGNVISGNQGVGISVGLSGLQPNTDTKIWGNYIGTDATGTKPLGNLGAGILVIKGTRDILIGGTAEGGKGNVISGNSGEGILLSGPDVEQNRIYANFIGTAADGVSRLGNGGSGIAFIDGASQNGVGGLRPELRNVIAFNAGSGVAVSGASTVNNYILGNSIYDNGKVGINLSTPGETSPYVTANDAGDADTGPNNLQNFPVLTSVVSDGGSLKVQGTLNSEPNGQYRLEFFRSVSPGKIGEGVGQAQTWVGTLTLNTDADGNATYSQNFPARGEGQYFTATAMNALNCDTSEFSAPFDIETSTAAFDISGKCVSYFADGSFTGVQPKEIDSAHITMVNDKEQVVAETDSDRNGAFVFKQTVPGTFHFHGVIRRDGQPDIALYHAGDPVTVSDANVDIGQFAVFSIFGTVKKPNSQGENVPLANATVQLNLGSTVLGTKTTDSSGRYEFRNLVPGSYSVGATSDSYTFTGDNVSLLTTGQAWSPCARANLVGTAKPSGSRF